MDKEELKKEIMKKPSILRDMDEVPEDLAIFAVKKQWNNLKYIKNPSEEVLREAVMNKGWAIRYIENPSEEMKLLAVMQDPDSLQYMENPSEEVKKAAVGKSWNAIKYIGEPSSEIKLLAVEKNEQAIGYIKNLGGDDIRNFIRGNINVVKYIYDSIDMDDLTDILMEKFSGNPGEEYVRNFYELKILDMDKIKFINDYGSRETRKILCDYILGR